MNTTLLLNTTLLNGLVYSHLLILYIAGEVYMGSSTVRKDFAGKDKNKSSGGDLLFCSDLGFQDSDGVGGVDVQRDVYY